MSSYSSAQAEWVLNALAAYDFSKMTHLCDVGGGHGYILARLLAQYPHIEGTVLERAEVISDSARLWAGKLGVSDRCRYVAGDMFKAAPPAVVPVIQNELHHIRVDECVRILQNQLEAATPGGRVFIVEHVIPDPETSHFAKLF